jgi:subtilisin family serine protease
MMPPMSLIRPRTLAALLPFAAAACGGVRPTPTPTPATDAAPVAVTRPPIVTTVEPKALTEAPGDWHRLDYATDGVLGVGSERALRELLAGRRPQREVVVAVIDAGTDTLHPLLAPNLWRNPRERADGRDNDGNGHADDLRGWSLIGGRDSSVNHDTYEITRLYAACRGLPAGAGLPKPADADCTGHATAYAAKRSEVQGTLQQITQISAVLTQVNAALTQAVGGPLTKEKVTALQPTTPQLTQAKQLWLQLAENGLDEAELAEARKAYDGQFRYGLDTMFSPRAIVGDDWTTAGPAYGSADVVGPDPSHGTHVAGIIGAVRGNGPVQGIAPNVKLMTLRAVPDGDERDKDVAAAIRYAADQGARIINMSFGKGYSPQRPLVEDAVRYAMGKGVLLVHAAGNDAEDVDVSPNFPSPVLSDGTRADLWLEVGASSWRGLRQLPAAFSNYGQARVDLFAPGDDVLSTMPGGTTKAQSGTSMAAPVVSGVAALLMTYFPDLSAAQVKDLILRSVRPLGEQDVVKPGTPGELVKFKTLSRSGGVIDAYAAVKMALDIRP